MIDLYGNIVSHSASFTEFTILINRFVLKEQRDRSHVAREFIFDPGI